MVRNTRESRQFRPKPRPFAARQAAIARQLVRQARAFEQPIAVSSIRPMVAVALQALGRFDGA